MRNILTWLFGAKPRQLPTRYIPRPQTHSEARAARALKWN